MMSEIDIAAIPEQHLCDLAMGILAALQIPVAIGGHVEYTYDLADDPVVRRQQLQAVRAELVIALREPGPRKGTK